MLISFIKFFHLLCTLGLLGITFFCLIRASTTHFSIALLTQLNRILLWLTAFAILTGTLLVYTKHFSFHTPWIEAAYLLTFILGTLVSLLLFAKRSFHLNRWLWRGIYIIFIMILIGIIHDAVTKTTFLIK